MSNNSIFLQPVDRRVEKQKSTHRKVVEGEICVQECPRRRDNDVELRVYGAAKHRRDVIRHIANGP